MCALELILYLKHVFTCSATGMKDCALDCKYHFIFQAYNSKVNREWWDEPNRETLVGAVSWVYESFSFPLNHYISFLLPVSRSLTTEWYHLWLWWNGQPKVSQALCYICFNPARQSSMPQLFTMFLLISIMKGLIMLMRRPNGLVLSVGGTAVGLQGKSCAKCVT